MKRKYGGIVENWCIEYGNPTRETICPIQIVNRRGMKAEVSVEEIENAGCHYPERNDLF
jgi:hypothetical protein